MVKTLLVVECDKKTNWCEQFNGCLIDGEPLRVEQAAWEDILLVSYPGSCVATLNSSSSPIRVPERTVAVDFVFIRSVTRGIRHADYRNILLGFLHYNIPSVNSILSIFLCCERPTSFAALKKIQQKLGPERFPLVEQTFYASHREMGFPPDFPIVCKIGHAQSGYGKMKIQTNSDFEDFRTVCAMVDTYVTAESFVDWDWDGRVQKIGHHYRAFKRTSNHWKGNVFGFQAQIEEIEVTEEMKLWVDECSMVFGGLDILGLDFVHCKETGKFHILELNDTAIGLFHQVEAEDMEHMRDLVLTRMSSHFLKTDENDVEIDGSINVELKNARDEIAALKRRVKILEGQLEEKNQTKPRTFMKFFWTD